jgi:Protein of unknown function (DUF3618)
MATRSPEQIRASIEQNRTELAVTVDRLRGELVELADWRKQIVRHQQPVLVTAAVTGFVIGGGIAALGGIVFGRRRRRRR